jgi:transcriptional regulator with XRE-family HTH domain
MTLLVHRKIKEFRLSKKLKQVELAAKLGVCTEWFSSIERGIHYPSTEFITKINELGANIHPSIFSPFALKLAAVFRGKRSTIRSARTNYRMGQPMPQDEISWIRMQLLKRNVSHTFIAKQAGCSPTMVGMVMSGRNRSLRVQIALAEALGYGSFDELVAAWRREKGGEA